jgi:hypothetical protein
MVVIMLIGKWSIFAIFKIEIIFYAFKTRVFFLWDREYIEKISDDV